MAKLRSTTLPRWISDGRSAIHGRGIYARELIPDGTHVVQYLGERITKPEAKRREARRLVRQRNGGDDCVYIFDLNRRHDLDGDSPRNVARLINHSCTPNCRAENIRGKIWIIARREISEGEELTFDYGFSFREWAWHPCRCKTARCPGYIVASDQRWRLRRIRKMQRDQIADAMRRATSTPGEGAPFGDQRRSAAMSNAAINAKQRRAPRPRTKDVRAPV